ncbi:uncharacterized protein A1O5_08626 [Cladophialophora psammophila CBS 110553]|uniref:Enoyl reductase (ER) domain-containing protein n=1 Tax=Cladophialophora psammophila CBS 110553 TaxID=1182543 RepID=W9WTN9_9EURO|nr:uncharacterized protein A1O5_08626 [Cladophialophora psammophila CBS 110553]EXJ68011.1 hypothetical protein A1O5_08626 [Cladophialophora psammophila CBS 110553]
MSSTQKTARWMITPNLGLDGLQDEVDVPVPQLTGRQCLVRINAVSLNYRDIAMATGRYPLPTSKSFVPGLHAVHKDHQDGIITPEIRQSTLGSQRYGVLQKLAVFEETGLVALPKNLSYIEGACLSCAAVTAWNCLFGLESRALRSGELVLTQGTGGVSLFAIQFALAVGAVVIATTSSRDKELRLEALGVQHVINYKSNPD